MMHSFIHLFIRSKNKGIYLPETQVIFFTGMLVKRIWFNKFTDHSAGFFTQLLNKTIIHLGIRIVRYSYTYILPVGNCV